MVEHGIEDLEYILKCEEELEKAMEIQEHIDKSLQKIPEMEMYYDDNQNAVMLKSLTEASENNQLFIELLRKSMEKK